ncbi:MAG: hypothetical protein K8W52_23255 [Deltaproteobacteria bacterium]|nr:hypothetical protein [Deltaproteobacteria bacterium]
MTRVELRRAWLQKHPTPTRDNGDFHWHPEAIDRELRAAAADGVRGAARWVGLREGRAAWAVPFTELAPSDRRPYVGAMLTIASGAGRASLLDALDDDEGTRWDAAAAMTWSRAIDPERCLAAPVEARGWPRDAIAAMAAGLCGEAAHVPEAPWTPRAIASLASWLDEPTAPVGFAIGGARSVPTSPRDRLVAQVWLASARDREGARRVWRVIASLDGKDLAARCAAIERGAAACRDAGALAAWLAARGASISAELDPQAPWPWLARRWAVASPLARERARGPLVEALASRVIVDQLDGAALRTWRALRIEAVLPAALREQLVQAVRARVPGIVEAAGG